MSEILGRDVQAHRVVVLQSLVKDRFEGNQFKFALAIAKSPSQVSQWLSGKKPVGIKVIIDIEDSLSLPRGTIDTALCKEGGLKTTELPLPDFLQPPPVKAFVPIISSQRAASWDGIPTEEELRQTFPVRTGEVSKKAFAMRVEGNSMVNPGPGYSFPPNTTIVVDPDKTGEPGKFVVAKLDENDTTVLFKLYETDGRTHHLVSLDPKYNPIQIDPKQARLWTALEAVIALP